LRSPALVAMRGVVAATLCCLAHAGQPATRKRGFVGYVRPTKPWGTCQDAAALDLADSWFWNWLSLPYYKPDACDAHPQAAEFVPIVNSTQDLQRLLDPKSTDTDLWNSYNVHFLMGFNEPDTGNGNNHPAMCSPAAAAVAWPGMQEIAKRFNPPLRLVAPAVSTKGPDAWDENGASPWLDQFLMNCSQIAECDVDAIEFIAMHYHGSDVAELERKLKGAASRYNKKVWLSELNILEWGKADTVASRSEQDQFLAAVLPMLDASPDVYRYGWVSARGAPNAQNGGSNLLPFESLAMDLTSTGKIYAQREVLI